MSGLPGVLGQTAFNVAGHKVPYGAIAAVAGVAGVVLVLKARSGGSNLVSVGAPGAAAAPSDLASYGSSFGPDYSASLSNLSQQVSDLAGLVTTQQRDVAMPSAPLVPPVTPAGPPPAPAPPQPAPAMPAPTRPVYIPTPTYFPTTKKTQPVAASGVSGDFGNYALDTSFPSGPPQTGKFQPF